MNAKQLVQAAGSQAKLVLLLDAVGYKTTTRSIRRWLEDGIPARAKAAVAQLPLKAPKPKEEPKVKGKGKAKGKKQADPYEGLLEVLGTWKRVAQELRVSEKRLRDLRKSSTDLELMQAATVLKHWSKQKKSAMREVESRRKAAIKRLKEQVDALNEPGKNKGGIVKLAKVYGVDEKRIREWIKKGPPDDRLKAIEKLQPYEEPLEKPEPAKPPKKGKGVVLTPLQEAEYGDEYGPSEVVMAPVKEGRKPVLREKEVAEVAKVAKGLKKKREAEALRIVDMLSKLAKKVSFADLGAHLQVKGSTVRGWLRKATVPEKHWQTVRELNELYATGITAETMAKLRNMDVKGKPHHCKDRVKHLEGDRTSGWLQEFQIRKLLDEDLIKDIEGKIKEAYKRFASTRGDRWTILIFTTALTHADFSHDRLDYGFKPPREGSDVMTLEGHQVRPGTSPKAVHLEIPMGELLDEYIERTSDEELDDDEREEREDKLRNRVIPDSILNITHKHFGDALANAVALMRYVMAAGVIYIDGVTVKHYKIHRKKVEPNEPGIEPRRARPPKRKLRRR